MQEAVTLFPHSISHSNNGEQLISIEFLPLFNRFAVLFELSKHSSKASFQIPALLLFSLPYDQSSLDGKKERKEKPTENGQSNAFCECEGEDYSATYIYCISSFEHQGIFRKRKVYLELNSTYVKQGCQFKCHIRGLFSLRVTRQSSSVTSTPLLLFYS